MGGFLVVVLALIFLIAIAALLFSVRIIKQFEKGLVIRLGRYSHTADAGLVFLIPFIDSLIRVDMREALINVLPQQVITADNVVVTVDA
ncbi:SPFH domain-containing protein, partial [Promineifilum sp.]|uniref:SPFH domain-containing protein n=1 Tax=Promineifilum sp. TaxID=2664178 RepID=UPI0035ADE9B3